MTEANRAVLLVQLCVFDACVCRTAWRYWCAVWKDHGWVYAPLNSYCTFEKALGCRRLPWDALCLANLLLPARVWVVLWLASIDAGLQVLVYEAGMWESIGLGLSSRNSSCFASLKFLSDQLADGHRPALFASFSVLQVSDHQ